MHLRRTLSLGLVSAVLAALIALPATGGADPSGCTAGGPGGARAGVIIHDIKSHREYFCSYEWLTTQTQNGLLKNTVYTGPGFPSAGLPVYPGLKLYGLLHQVLKIPISVNSWLYTVSAPGQQWDILQWAAALTHHGAFLGTGSPVPAIWWQTSTRDTCLVLPAEKGGARGVYFCEAPHDFINLYVYQKPRIGVTLTVSPSPPVANQQVTYTATVSDLEAGEGAATYRWYRVGATTPFATTTVPTLKETYPSSTYGAVAFDIYVTVTTASGTATGVSSPLKFTLTVPQSTTTTTTTTPTYTNPTTTTPTTTPSSNPTAPSTATPSSNPITTSTPSQTLYPGPNISGQLIGPVASVPASSFPVESQPPPQFVQVKQPPVPPATLPGSIPPLGAFIGGAVVALLLLLGVAAEQRSNRRPVQAAPAV